MKLVLFIFMIWLFSFSLKAQTIVSVHLGDSASTVLNNIGLIVENTSGDNVTYDVKYYNGIIVDVQLYVYNTYLQDFKITATFCRHHIMEKGILKKVKTQYLKISLEKLQSIYEGLPDLSKIGDYYFSPDFGQYTQLYLAKNGLATSERKKTDLSDLTIFPKKARKLMAEKIKENEENEKQKQLAIAKGEKEAEAKMKQEVEQEKKKKYGIESKIYDLNKDDTVKYNEVFTQIKKIILINCGWDRFYDEQGLFKIPKFEELEQLKDKKFTTLNTYDIYLKSNGDKSDYNKEIDLVSGTDSACNLFSRFPISAIKVDGYKVISEAKYYNINVEYSRGITRAELKNGVINFTDYIPDKEFQPYLKDNIKYETEGKYSPPYAENKIDGNYYVVYEASNIAGEIKVNIIEIVRVDNFIWSSNILLYGMLGVAALLLFILNH